MATVYRTPIQWPRFKYFDSNDLPLEFGKVYTYHNGTTVTQTTSKDPIKYVPNTNPVILDENGEAPIFFDGHYDIKIDDKDDTTILSTITVRNEPYASGYLEIPSTQQTIEVDTGFNVSEFVYGFSIRPDKGQSLNSVVGQGGRGSGQLTATNATLGFKNAASVPVLVEGRISEKPGKIVFIPLGPLLNGEKIWIRWWARKV